MCLACGWEALGFGVISGLPSRGAIGFRVYRVEFFLGGFKFGV